MLLRRADVIILGGAKILLGVGSAIPNAALKVIIVPSIKRERPNGRPQSVKSVKSVVGAVGLKPTEANFKYQLHAFPVLYTRPDVGLSLKFSALVAARVAATLVVAALGDVLFTRCSGSRSRVNLLPTYLVRELAAELGGYGATQSALAVGSVQHVGGCHDGRMSLGVFRVLHAQLQVGIDGQEVLASLR